MTELTESEDLHAVLIPAVLLVGTSRVVVHLVYPRLNSVSHPDTYLEIVIAFCNMHLQIGNHDLYTIYSCLFQKDTHSKIKND